ncbi:MAG TPA: CopD family protein [Rhodocyclaceae bacterium]|uniref:CopD family protein n=1 Tax=Zoogloea sp. TaxID=49181 RepID=UPI002C509C47|nr:CopD family protein [Zoogloea sp.]HMV17526.1 CopD family protein [Rhodocyclaceae bacterium]HMV62992.1 CopD family protein [Rhodocyclaceae bacterium]HMW52793.1 CopD family protein [Rhodocyclaceae bacterium]HMY49752.1 CopD family protein [Rhodocyclaceae bacterium]HMZ75333.1 CopD family protein [Rhodocyclaceae bacterium]
MLIVKALHIIFVTSWFAGLFYLPRLFVNHAMVTDPATIERIALMERKLYRFMTPLGILAVLLGMWLWFGYGFVGGWLHAKTALVTLLIVYHLYCGRLLRAFAEGRNTRSHVWYRFFNEIPVLVLFAVVFLVVLKPF